MAKIFRNADKLNEKHGFKMGYVKIFNALLLVAVLALSSVLFSACTLYTVVKHDKNKDPKQGVSFYFADDKFDVTKFVDSVWDSKVIPTMTEKAVDITELIKATKNNAEEAGKKYGISNSKEGNAWNFIVKGKGKVLAVNKESRNGTLDIDLLPYDNKADLKIQIGPVIKGAAVRDSLEFIKFDDFKNQMVFAEISNAFHKRIAEQILSKVDFTTLQDKEIDFIGAFTAAPSGEIILTPVKLSVTGGGK